MRISDNAYKLTAIIVFCFINVTAQKITILQNTKPTSIRGLSIVDNKTAWVSGSSGSVGITTDGGKNWMWQQVKGFEKSDFRDIEAFSDKVAVAITSGTPAIIIKTTDGGANWQVNYQKADSSYFLDAMDFADQQHGWVVGDPIAGKFLLLKTNNGGDTWEAVDNAPVALKQEAAFAASGTCLRINNNYITIVTGGGHSRLLFSPTNKIKWDSNVLPLTNGSQSQGAFSVAYGETKLL